MKREHAIKKQADRLLRKLSVTEREVQLETMQLEDWSESLFWNSLREDLKIELDEVELRNEPDSKRYDPALLMWLQESLAAVANSYLARELNIDLIEGSPDHREACPCCGRRTLDERGWYDICSVCWWEDSGQDNEDANRTFGLNGGLSLIQARLNYLEHGLFNPKRADLMQLKESADKYVKGRNFEIVDGRLIEKGTDWVSEI